MDCKKFRRDVVCVQNPDEENFNFLKQLSLLIIILLLHIKVPGNTFNIPLSKIKQDL